MTSESESFDPSVARVVALALPGARITHSTQRHRATRAVRLRPGLGLGVIEGGELVVATLAALKEIGWSDAVAEQLTQAGVSGIVIVDGDDDAFQALACQTQPLPVAVVCGRPSEARHIEELLAATIARARRELYDYAQQLQHQVVDLAISGGGLEDVARALARVSGLTVVIRAGERVLHRSPEAWLPASTVPNGILDRDSAAPIRRAGEVRGACVLYGNGGQARDAVLGAVRGATACSIVLGREEPDPPLLALLDREREPTVPAQEMRRAGYDFDRPQMAVAVRPADGDLLGAFRLRWPQHAHALHDGTLLVLASGTSGAELAAHISSLSPDATVAWASQGAGVHAAVEALVNARSALGLGIKLGLRIAGHASLIADLALQTLPEDRARTYVSEVLGPIAANERDVERRTLWTYLSSNRNAAAASTALNVHRNTVLYRLRGIEHELGRSLDDAATLFDLELALRLRRLFS